MGLASPLAQGLGEEGCQAWPQVGVVPDRPPATQTPTTTPQYTPIDSTQSTRPAGGRRDRTCQFLYLFESAFRGTKERFPHSQTSPRRQRPQQIHPNIQIPDDVDEDGTPNATTGMVHGVYRSERRLLARTSGPVVSSVPSVFGGETHLSIQGSALWPEYSTQDILQGPTAHSRQAVQSGSTDSNVPGRLAPDGSFQGRMRLDGAHDAPCGGGDGIVIQQGQISPLPYDDNTMVGHDVELGGRNYDLICGQPTTLHTVALPSPPFTDLHPQAMGELDGISLPRILHSPPRETPHSEALGRGTGIPQPPGQGHSNTLPQEHQALPEVVVEGGTPSPQGPVGRPTPIPRPHDRCLKSWLGLPVLTRPPGPGNVGPDHGPRPHKHQGTYDSMASSHAGAGHQGRGDSGTIGQHYDGPVHQQTRDHEIPSPPEGIRTSPGGT